MADTATKERPILFSGPMVRAILSGEKTQTRRAVKPQPVEHGHGAWEFGGRMFASDEEMRDHLFHEVYGVKGTPYGALWHEGGDRLWVRETCRYQTCDMAGVHVEYKADGKVLLAAGHDLLVDSRSLKLDERLNGRKRWRPSIHMPKWASRITLEITNVRVERLQAISKDDAQAEGIERDNFGHWLDYSLSSGGFRESTSSLMRPVDSFRSLWDSINAARGFGWYLNPWVWVIEFKRLEADHAE